MQIFFALTNKKYALSKMTIIYIELLIEIQFSESFQIFQLTQAIQAKQKSMVIFCKKGSQ